MKSFRVLLLFLLVGEISGQIRGRNRSKDSRSKLVRRNKQSNKKNQEGTYVESILNRYKIDDDPEETPGLPESITKKEAQESSRMGLSCDDQTMIVAALGVATAILGVATAAVAVTNPVAAVGVALYASIGAGTGSVFGATPCSSAKYQVSAEAIRSIVGGEIDKNNINQAQRKLAFIKKMMSDTNIHKMEDDTLHDIIYDMSKVLYDLEVYPKTTIVSILETTIEYVGLIVVYSLQLDKRRFCRNYAKKIDRAVNDALQHLSEVRQTIVDSSKMYCYASCAWRRTEDAYSNCFIRASKCSSNLGGYKYLNEPNDCISSKNSQSCSTASDDVKVELEAEHKLLVDKFEEKVGGLEDQLQQMKDNGCFILSSVCGTDPEKKFTGKGTFNGDFKKWKCDPF